MNPRPIDPAALAGATMACAVASLLQRGPFGVMDMLVGVVLLLILMGYDDATPRSPGQSRAVAAVTGFAALVAVGFPAEFVARFISTRQVDTDDSAVPAYVLVGVWLIVTLVMYVVDRKRTSNLTT